MSYDPKVFELGWDFIMAGERYRTIPMEKIPAEDRYEMCGLFKQSTFGDIDIKFAGAQGEPLRNCEAWSNLQGLSKTDAIRRYVAKSDELTAAYQ